MDLKSKNKVKTREDLLHEIEALRVELDEANDTINAIRSGEVDALIVNDNAGLKVFTLKSADQTYRLFIEKMTEGAVTINEKGIIIYSNTRFALMLGLPLSKVIGSSFFSYLPDELQKECSTILSKGWSAESKGETYLYNSDKVLCPYLLSLSTLDLDEGKALSIILTDLSVQKQNEKILKEKNDELQKTKKYTEKLNNELEDIVKERTKELLMSREHFKFLSNNIPVIVWTAKPNGDVDYYNNRWYEYTGMDFEKSKGWNWKDAIHPEDLEDLKKNWNLCLNTGNIFKIEYRLKGKRDGEYKWHYAQALPFKNENNEIIAWIGTVTDIEDQKLAMLKKDEFISLASHELKTPVTSLKAFTQILQIGMEEEGNARAVDLLGRMDKQINKLTHLISDLLDVTKINAGKIVFNKEKLNLNKLIEEIADEMQRTSLNHEIILQLSEDCEINADRNRIGQVITNLLSNAIKYSPESNKIIVSSDIKQGEFKFYVKDFGIGISINEQAKLFTRFFRGNDERVKTFPGLGLGLYISNEIVKRHDGSINFESEPGKGSNFCVTLPCN